jgi:hypothetical protein
VYTFYVVSKSEFNLADGSASHERGIVDGVVRLWGPYDARKVLESILSFIALSASIFSSDSRAMRRWRRPD